MLAFIKKVPLRDSGTGTKWACTLALALAALCSGSVSLEASTVQFSSASYSISEGSSSGFINITVTLDAPSSNSINVNYATSNGTASSGSDYSSSSGSLFFSPGQTSASFMVFISNDNVIELDETVNITLNNPSGATLGDPATAVLTIVDDDTPPTVQLSSSSYSVNEGVVTGFINITVTISHTTSQTVSVHYATSDGTANAPADYSAANGTVSIFAGQSSATFQVYVNNDSIPESNETVNITISDPVNANLGSPSSAVLTIIDNDNPPTVQFSSATYSVNEGVATGFATITVTVSQVSGQSVTVTYATSNGTAQAGSDYTAATGTVTILAGQSSATFTVSINNDTLAEPSETINLALSNPIHATLGSPSNAVLTIIDNDNIPTVQFSAADYYVNETAGPSALVTVTLSQASGQTVTVSYATSNIEATAGSDYTAASGSLTFLPGDTSKTISITILNDTIAESTEGLYVTLSNPVNATLGTPNPTVLHILDDDAIPTVQFLFDTQYVSEASGQATVYAVLSQATGKTVSVSFATSNGTATAGSDYSANSGTLVFSPGQTSASFAVSITNDALAEPNETIILTLSNPVNATLGTPNPSTLVIVDNDQVRTVQFGEFYTVNEGAGTVTVTVFLSQASLSPITVQYGTTNGSATAGSDYTTASGTLTFNTLEITKTITIGIINDAVPEGTESFNVGLSNPVGATIGSWNPTQVTILDNDVAVQFQSSTFSVNEASGTATITVTLSTSSAVNVSVNYATSNGSATAGSDYTAASGTLTFTPGQTTKTFTVPITNDATAESSETINLTLSVPVNASLGTPSTAVLTIQDDDSAMRAKKSDFNGDRKADILLRHPSSGEVLLWLMN